MDTDGAAAGSLGDADCLMRPRERGGEDVAGYLLAKGAESKGKGIVGVTHDAISSSSVLTETGTWRMY